MKLINTKFMYDHMLNETYKNKSLPVCIGKWNTELRLNDNETWTNIFQVPFVCSSETDLQSVQYSIIHRFFPCNHWLHNVKVIDNPNCCQCNLDDTIHHYFVHCGNLKVFWHVFTRWWNRITKQNVQLSDDYIIFGFIANFMSNKQLNYCIMLAKKYIYNKKKCKVFVLDFWEFLIFLKQKLKLKRLYHKMNFSLNIFDRMWSNTHLF